MALGTATAMILASSFTAFQVFGLLTTQLPFHLSAPRTAGVQTFGGHHPLGDSLLLAGAGDTWERMDLAQNCKPSLNFFWVRGLHC